jgi:hypothetical protein
MAHTNNDYSQMTLEALQAEEKKLKGQKIMTAFLIGFLMGVAVYAATHHKGFLLTVISLYFPFRVAKKYSDNLKNIQAEINSRQQEQD